MAKQVALRLREAGVLVTAASLTKDSGPGTVACGTGWQTGVLRARRANKTKRLARIRILARQSKKCRSLIWTGAKPQGTWGLQGVGLAPHSIL
jgi:hypothetical protein